MSWTIEKTFTFEAAHRLPFVPEGHKCGRIHGHSYIVTLRLSGQILDKAGMIFEYGRLAEIVRPILDGELDHRYLNEINGLENPTTEVLAKWIYDRLAGAPGQSGPLATRLGAVIVNESGTTRCEYSP